MVVISPYSNPYALSAPAGFSRSRLPKPLLFQGHLKPNGEPWEPNKDRVEKEKSDPKQKREQGPVNPSSYHDELTVRGARVALDIAGDVCDEATLQVSVAKPGRTKPEKYAATLATPEFLRQKMQMDAERQRPDSCFAWYRNLLVVSDFKPKTLLSTVKYLIEAQMLADVMAKKEEL